MEVSLRILKRPCPTQVVEVVLLQETPHLGGVPWWGLGSGQPALHFRAKIFIWRHAIGFQARLLKEVATVR